MKQNLIIRFCILLLSLTGFHAALAQPTVSVVPASGATGVSPSAPIVFTFSTAMNTDPNVTFAVFYDTTGGFTPKPVTSVWSAGNTVLTCTPTPAFVSNHGILWALNAEDENGDSLDGIPTGTFTTGSGSGSGGGSGTNAVTTFSVGKAWEYNQTNTAAPALDADFPYAFSALTSLASNRTATAITVTFPNAAVSNLTQNFVQPEDYYLFGSNTNLTTFNANYPTGNYVFNVTSNAANQQVTVNLPAVTQPNAPHVSNYAAAQTINPSQPFTLTWDAFSGGTSADYIFVSIGENFETGDFGTTNALKGTATSVAIPAGTLSAKSNYDGIIGFYHAIVTTNVAGKYVTTAYVGSLTQFSLNTAGTVSAPVLTNATRTAGNFSFDILTSPGQTLTVVYQTNLTSAVATWPILLTTNSPGSKVHITDPRGATNKVMFYRARNGN